MTTTLTLFLYFSSLFPDVVNCMQTDNLELKKLVYLYLMNYAKSQPDMAIMAVNTFVKVGWAKNFLHTVYAAYCIHCVFQPCHWVLLQKSWISWYVIFSILMCLAVSNLRGGSGRDMCHIWTIHVLPSPPLRIWLWGEYLTRVGVWFYLTHFLDHRVESLFVHPFQSLTCTFSPENLEVFVSPHRTVKILTHSSVP